MSRPERRQFTLRDLIALVVGLFLLLGLLLPASRGPREMSRLAVCKYNQRQIADAMVLFATTHGMMPAAISSPIDPATGMPVARPFGWVQGMFAELGRTDLVPFAYTMTTANAPNLSLLVCPEENVNRYGNGAHGGPLSYVVNGGSFKNWKPDPGCPIDWPANGVWECDTNMPGHPRPKRSLEFIGKHKGLELTISLSENLDARSYILSSPQANYEDEILWDPSAPLGFNQDAGNGRLDNAHARPSSNHGGGAVVTFCDSHVAFISDSISYKVYATLMVSDPAADVAPPGKTGTWPNLFSSFLIWPLNPSQIPVK